MKTRNIIIFLGTAALFIGILMSCSKEVNRASFDCTSIPQAKGNVLKDSISAMIVHMWELCDNAYQKDSIRFLNACNAENINMFQEITGITPEMQERLNDLVDAETGNAVASLGVDWADSLECIPCYSGSLANLALYIQNMHDVFAHGIQQNIIDPIPLFSDITDSCIILCTILQSLPPIEEDLCILSCNLKRAANQWNWDDFGGPIIEP
jgi:hypothetical protein